MKNLLLLTILLLTNLSSLALDKPDSLAMFKDDQSSKKNEEKKDEEDEEDKSDN